MTLLGSLCSGVGGLELGVERVLGARTVWQSEIDPHAGTVLAARWPGVPNLGDLRAVDWSQVEPVDVLCFGFPCQDISSAGRRAGLEGEQSALWFDCADAVRALRPRYLLVENVSALLVRGFERVLADLAEMGYVGRWGCLRSSAIGAPHRRERVFIAAVARGARAGRDAGAVPRPATADRWAGADVRTAIYGSAAATDPGGAARRSAGDAQRRDGASPNGRRGASQPGGRRSAAAHADGQRLAGRPEQDRQPEAGVEAPRRGDAAGRSAPAWGPYEPAIRRWEAIHGPAPRPRDDRGRLNPELPEWMMGFPAGWVTDSALGLPRTAQLRLIGNAVQPQVAELAAHLLLEPLMAAEVAA